MLVELVRCEMSSAFDEAADDWELKDYSAIAAANGLPTGDPDQYDIDDDDGDDNLSDCSIGEQEEASIELFNYLVQLKFSGILSAKHVCIIAYWAKEAGLSGRAAKLAASPEGKNFSRAFDRATGMNTHMKADLYEFQVPGSEPASLSRVPVNMCTTFVFKELAAEVVRSPISPTV